MTAYNLDDLYTEVRYGDRDAFKRKLNRVIENRGEMPVTEPKTAVSHIKGWGRRVGAILGAAGGIAALAVSDVLAWQNLSWIDGVGVSVGVAAVAAGTIWYIVDEYNER